MHLTRLLPALVVGFFTAVVIASTTACDSSVVATAEPSGPTATTTEGQSANASDGSVAHVPELSGTLPTAPPSQPPIDAPVRTDGPSVSATTAPVAPTTPVRAAESPASGIAIVTLPSSEYARAVAADAGALPTLDGAAPVSMPVSAPVPEADAALPADSSELLELRRRSGRIAIASSRAEVQLEAALVAEGQGSARVGAIHMKGGVGVIELEGAPVKALAYAPVDWTEAGYMLYQTLAVATDRLFIVWLYCADGRIQSVYSEGTHDAPLAWEPADGSCTEIAGGTPTSVTFPALDMATPALVDGFRVAGPHLNLEPGKSGTFTLDGKNLSVFPFQTVDCSTCPEDGFDGWYELHALLWDAGARRLSFGAFYLSASYAGQVGLDYVIDLPDVTFGRPPRWFPADWSHLAANKSAATVDPRTRSLARPLTKPPAR